MRRHPAGYGMFFGTGCLLMLFFWLATWALTGRLADAGAVFAGRSVPLLAVLTAFWTVCSAKLVRREGASKRMLYLSGMLTACACALFLLQQWQDAPRWLRGICFTADGLIFVLECQFAAALLLNAALLKRKIPYDRQYVLVLGCGLRGDGSLTPLLKGRADRAVRFVRLQEQAGGPRAFMIPCGGKGTDEPRPEAEALAEYLRACGIAEERILPETRSRDTEQNLRFSKNLMKGISPQTAFATSSFHVLRAELIAHDQGIAACGMGSRTRWYFWPGAFVREFAGLMMLRFRQNVLLLILTAAASAAVFVLTAA